MGIISTIIGAIITGAIIGPLGRLVLPGKQDISIGMTILIGAGAALVGGFIASLFGVGNTAGIDWIKLGIQVAAAAGGVTLYLGSRSGS